MASNEAIEYYNSHKSNYESTYRNKYQEVTTYVSATRDIITSVFGAGVESEKRKHKWHDLRKDPKDLPHDETQVLIINNFDDVQYYLGYFDNFHSEWLSERMLKLFDVIAWCELPKLLEE